MSKFKAFLLVWVGQVVSLFGSSLSGFALGVWLYQETGSASNFALVAMCGVLPQMVVSPFTGVLVDRYSRRRMMVFGDSGSALCTLALAFLFMKGIIQPWHIFLGTALSSIFSALQAPAYAALVAESVERIQLGRANGLIQFGQGLAEVLAPATAGVLVAGIGVSGVLVVDLSTFIFAVITLVIAYQPVRLIPHRENISMSDETSFHENGHRQSSQAEIAYVVQSNRVDSWKQVLSEGWTAVRAQAGLSVLLRFQMVFSFLWSLFAVLVSPMILGFADSTGLGMILSVAGGGMLIGSLVLSAWGGPKQRLRGLLGFELVSAVAFVLMGIRPDLGLVAMGAFIAHFTLAFVAGLNQSIWQSQVSGAVMGRVLGLRQAAIKGATLLAYLIAGGMADRLEPLFQPGGILARYLGLWVGVGPGRSIAALCVLIGVIKIGAVTAVSISKGRRSLDTI